MGAHGARVAFLPMLTRSQTANLLLLPGLLLRYRLAGYRILHIHWIYSFAPVWVDAVPAGRRLLQAWYGLWLRTARAAGYRIVWTAHNLLPLAPVLADDRAGRRLLAGLSSAVIAHNPGSVPALEALGARRVCTIPFGRYGDHYPQGVTRRAARRRLGLDEAAPVVAFVGAIERYKGVDVLLAAAARLDPALGLRLVVAGRCDQPAVRAEVEAGVAALGGRATLHLGHVPDDELQVYFAAADAVALPFRHVTNSSSLLLALEFGRPVVIPALGELAGYPDRLAVRFAPGDVGALADALEKVARMDAGVLAAMGEAGRAYTGELSWERSSGETLALFRQVLAEAPPCRRRP